MTNSDRRASFLKGLRAEKYAALFLMLKGYRVIERRYKTPVGEIDLIAHKKNTFCFIEVKARKNIDRAKESISAMQRRRIERAANLFTRELKNNPRLRFDAIFVTGWRIHHLKNAWRVGG